MRKRERTELSYILYVVLVVVLAGIYFFVPERREFFDYQRVWWGQMWRVIVSILP